ncbi:MAG: sulfotransferase [Pseudomonadota bacterium]
MSDLSSTESISQQAMELAKAGQFQAGLDKIAELGDGDADAESLYIKAVCLRKLHRYDEAVADLQQVVTLDPAYVRAHQEMGHIFLAEGKLQQAINAFEKAVASDSALLGSWRALSSLYAKTGNKAGQARAYNEIRQLEELHPALQTVKSHLNRDNLAAADQVCRHYMQQNKQDIEGMRLLAEIANRAKILDDAEFILESAVQFAPKHIGARFDYSNILMKRQKFGAAHEIAQGLYRDHSENLQFKALLAATHSGIGETQRAAELFRELIADKYHLEHAYLLLGHTEKTMGNLPAAIQAYQDLYGHKPDFGDAFWSLANTKTYKFTDDELAHMEDYKDRESTSPVDRVHFNFALGKAYEDRQDYANAFAAYHDGNLLNKQLLNYQAPEIQKRVARQKDICNAELFERLADVGADAPDPIFVLGLPRAGSTLLEQILASHSKVDGTLELPNILSLSRRLRGRGPATEDEEPQYPRILAELEHDYFRRFGEQYIEDTKVFRQGAEFFIDKMPNNFLHIGLIKLILPNAKVIDARRHPMACCFSGFKQLFAEGQEFTYGLQEIGHYYKHYVDVMDHWDEVLPGFVLRVQHEDVVADLETQVRRILDFCGLPFEQSCIEFYKTERNVRTPSSEQVRQPIYTTGLEQWRNFEPYLDPLIEALGPEVLERYPIK